MVRKSLAFKKSPDASSCVEPLKSQVSGVRCSGITHTYSYRAVLLGCIGFCMVMVVLEVARAPERTPAHKLPSTHKRWIFLVIFLSTT